MTTISWTERAQADLAAIRAFVEVDSPHYADVIVRRLLMPWIGFKTFRSPAAWSRSMWTW